MIPESEKLELAEKSELALTKKIVKYLESKKREIDPQQLELLKKEGIPPKISKSFDNIDDVNITRILDMLDLITTSFFSCKFRRLHI